MSVKLFWLYKFKMALFKYGFKRKYEGFHEIFFEGLHIYNFPQNFSASKLLWYTVCHVTTESVVMLRNKVIHR